MLAIFAGRLQGYCIFMPGTFFNDAPRLHARGPRWKAWDEMGWINEAFATTTPPWQWAFQRKEPAKRADRGGGRREGRVSKPTTTCIYSPSSLSTPPKAKRQGISRYGTPMAHEPSGYPCPARPLMNGRARKSTCIRVQRIHFVGSVGSQLCSQLSAPPAPIFFTSYRLFLPP